MVAGKTLGVPRDGVLTEVDSLARSHCSQSRVRDSSLKPHPQVDGIVVVVVLVVI